MKHMLRRTPGMGRGFALLLLILATPLTLWAQSFKVGGFIKAEYLYDTRQVAAARDGEFHLFPLPKSEATETDNLGAFVFFSRLSLTIGDLPEALGAQVTGYFESDFFGPQNGLESTFRLRRAFVRLAWDQAELYQLLMVESCLDEAVQTHAESMASPSIVSHAPDPPPAPPTPLRRPAAFPPGPHTPGPPPNGVAPQKPAPPDSAPAHKAADRSAAPLLALLAAPCGRAPRPTPRPRPHRPASSQQPARWLPLSAALSSSIKAGRSAHRPPAPDTPTCRRSEPPAAPSPLEAPTPDAPARTSPRASHRPTPHTARPSPRLPEGPRQGPLFPRRLQLWLGPGRYSTR